MLDQLLKFRNQDLSPYLNEIFERKDAILSEVKEYFITNLIEPLQNQIEEILANTQKKEEARKKAEEKLSELYRAKDLIEKQIAELT